MNGLDVGTSFIVLSKEGPNGSVLYKDFRDAFYTIKPSTPIAAKMIEKGLKGKAFIKDADGSFIILGQDAIEKAIERNDSAKRPMYRGVVSVKEKDSRRILAFILKEVVGKAKKKGEKLVFCVPAAPVDQSDDEFDVGYHEDVLIEILSGQGYDAKSIIEAEALCYSELEEEDYTGVALSFGAGMVNCCVMSSGEAVLSFSLTRGGDWVDRMSAVATGEADSVVQAEKEQGGLVLGAKTENQVLAAVNSYYERLIEYTVKHLAAHLEVSKTLPKFNEPLTIIVAGGTSKATGFVKLFQEKIEESNFPIPVKEIRHAKDPLHSVSKGCLIAAQSF